MNFGVLKTRLALNAGNMKSSHPFYAYLGQYVNDGVRLMIMRASEKFPNFQLFPEHKDVEWTDVTIVDQNYLDLPTDQFAVQRVFSLDLSTSPTLANSSWREVTWISPRGIDQLTKPTSQTAYPTNYTFREGRIYLYPTPRTSFTTYLKIDGIQDEPDMSNSSESPRTHARWHPAIIDYSSYLLLNDMDWSDTAQKFLISCDEKIKNIGATMVGSRMTNRRRTIQIVGMPRMG